ncbi:hypothetical protein BC943DRAFT_362850 [Umbelopsis sp. AD052]|nr:hypothetical protein BC943DRAFT_362850 [Umbelopsis sp. AD052]
MTSKNEKFPVTNKQAARIVQGLHTEVLVSGFKDKIFVVVTQYGRIGSLINTTFDIPPNLARSPSTVPTTSKFLMNSAATELSDLYLLYAASVSRAIATSNPRESRPVVLGIALKDTGDIQKRKELHENIMDMVRETIA